MDVNVKGVIVPSDDKWIYTYLGETSTCPRDLEDAVKEANGDRIDVYINSGGGDLHAANEMYALLKRTPNVKLHVTGQACSAATIVMCAGDCDISDTSLVMIHNAAMTAAGNHSDMEHAAEVLKTADRAVCAAYVAKTGKPDEEWLALMEQERWFTAREVVELGLCDRIAPTITNGICKMITAEQRREAELMRAKAQAQIDLEKIKMEGKS